MAAIAAGRDLRGGSRGHLRDRAPGAGAEGLRRLVAPHTPEETEGRTGISADATRELARDLAAAPRAAVYGRTGSCLGRNGTLVSFLLDALNVVTGNLDREGGAMFGDPPLDFEGIAHGLGLATYDKVRSRVGNLPEVLGSLPASLMAKEITTPGPGQIRALFVSAGNPVLSVPNGAELEAAIGQLDLCVAIDLYISDTARHADIVLPATTMYEREDFPLPFLGAVHDPLHHHDRRGASSPPGRRGRSGRSSRRSRSGSGSSPRACSAARWLGAPGSGSRPSASSTCCCGSGLRGTCSDCAGAASASRSCAATRTE